MGKYNNSEWIYYGCVKDVLNDYSLNDDHSFLPNQFCDKPVKAKLTPFHIQYPQFRQILQRQHIHMFQSLFLHELPNEPFQRCQTILILDEIHQHLFPLCYFGPSLQQRIPEVDVLLVAPVHENGHGCFGQVFLLHFDELPARGVDGVDHGPDYVDGGLAGGDLGAEEGVEVVAEGGRVVGVEEEVFHH